MRYNLYLYRLSLQVVPITNIVQNSISATNTIANLIVKYILYVQVYK